MAEYPWSAAERHEQYFSLITGANSGVGLAIAQRLIDEFLLGRSLSSHLVVVTTTRSPRKSRETIHALRLYLESTLSSPRIKKRLLSCSDAPYDPAAHVRRVHILSVQLDLCDLGAIYNVASDLVRGQISNPPEIPPTKYHYPSYRDLKLPRLDSMILNAGIGGWTSLNWRGMVKMLFRNGLTETTTFPDYKIAAVGRTTPGLQKPDQNQNQNENKTATAEDEPLLGEVFMANVFGHYVLAHELLPLLTRPSSEDAPGCGYPEIPEARIIWQSSIEAMGYHLDPSDLQGLKTHEPYESSKRLTDVLALTSNLPAVKPRSHSYFSASQAKGKPPKMYVAHPGIVVTTIFPLHWVLVFWYRFAMYLSRWVGSPWHTVTGYVAAIASVWLALETDSALTNMRADRSKWGSACGRLGVAECKRTEVTGWGWEGQVENLAKDEEQGILRKCLGRWSGSKDVTKEELHDFEALGGTCWAEMERLRLEWDEIVKGGGGIARPEPEQYVDRCLATGS